MKFHDQSAGWDLVDAPSRMERLDSPGGVRWHGAYVPARLGSDGSQVNCGKPYSTSAENPY